MGVHQVRNLPSGNGYKPSTESNTVIAEPAGVERLEAALSAWTAPLQYQMTGQSLFRTCFLLPLLHQAKPIDFGVFPTGS